MPRPKKRRKVECCPGSVYFKPRGIPLVELDEVRLPLDAFEAIRLADLQGLDQQAAAERMGVSRATFGRIIRDAHRVIAEALVHGKAIAIEAAPSWSEPHNQA